MHFDWESLTDSVHRCRLPFLDVTIGLVQGTAGALLVDTGTTLTEAHAIDDDVRLIAGCGVTHVVLTHKHFDHVLGSGGFADAQIFCAPEVLDYVTSDIAQLRDDALSYGADAAEIDHAIAALRAPQMRPPARLEDVYGAQVRSAVAIIAEMTRQVAVLQAELADDFESHPDAEIVRSQPGLGAVLGARRPGAGRVR